MRRLAALPVLALTAGLLTACTPAKLPLAALAVRDGRPVAVLVTCPGSFTQVSVYQRNDRDQPSPDGPHMTWGVSGHAAEGLVEVPLFGEPPTGWEVTEPRDIPAEEAGIEVRVRTLTELKPGVGYAISGSGRRNAIDVEFHTDDFARIAADQVLAAEDHRTTQVMSRERFLRRAEDPCG